MKMVAIISAGGFATRLGSARPKSLLEAAERPLLFWVIDKIIAAGADGVVVFQNRREWSGEYCDIVASFPNVLLVADQGVNSTFMLARRAPSILMAERYCFLYGHAPRPVAHIQRLLASPNVSATVCATTSRRRPLRVDDRFLEPPYAIPYQAFASTGEATSWEQFFEICPPSLSTMIGPPEFNFEPERRDYTSYVKNALASR